ncbi:MAG: PEP-CTERM sorting domain-containing protein [Verrucomicrobia bacterium]|nr:PEP-CTERM sorting domain-containing protein [Verrucomicrobiota bacterium]MCH8512426.1 PEP-CTERM sorting domain-containing protein [Kiritimatiellia bacterium]
MNNRQSTPRSAAKAVLLAGLACIFAFATVHASPFITVGVYDEQVENTNSVDANAIPSSDPFDGTALTVTEFSAMVLTAFNNNLGGVFDYHSDDTFTGTGSIGMGSSYDLTYGIDQNQTLGVTSLDGSHQSEQGTTPISGDRHLGTGGPNDGFEFDTPLLAFGITVLNRSGSNRHVNTMTFTLQDDTTVTPFANTQGGSGDDLFFGYQVSDPSNGIVSVFLDNGNHLHYDDMGFIVIPEPGTIVLLGIAGIAGLIGFRRRKS